MILPPFPARGIPLVFRTAAHAAAWCETELDNLVAIVRTARGCGMELTARQIALTMQRIPFAQHRWLAEMAANCRPALADVHPIGEKVAEA